MIYSDVVASLEKAGHPVRQLAAEGCIAITPSAGRVIAMAFSSHGPNLLWSHPNLGNSDLLRDQPAKLLGGIGGDRLWFAPELDYHWNGTPNWQTMGNYQIPVESDPGSYSFSETDPFAVSLEMKGTLMAHNRERSASFHVRRTIRMVSPPLAETDPLMQGIDYVGIETSHELRLDKSTGGGRVDLWHLLQMPVGSVLIAPIRPSTDKRLAEPLSYGQPGSWSFRGDHIAWTYRGTENAKLGLSAAVLTGRAAVFRRLEPGRLCVIIRHFPVDPHAIYGDHPHGVPRNDQAFQVWDGGGFGELEYHSPILDAKTGPRAIKEVDQLWAFGGADAAIMRLGQRMLGIEVERSLGSI